MESSGVTGIVLAGGRASRFGADKLSATFGDGPLLHRPIRALAQVCDEVIVVTRQEGPAFELPADLPVPVQAVPDEEPFGGPLAGLAVGLGRATHPVALVVGGDMPDLTPEVLRLLVRQVADHGATIAGLEFAGSTSQLPLALGTAAREAVRDLREGRERSLRALLAAAQAVAVPEADWRALDPEGLTLRDVDLPSDLPGWTGVPLSGPVEVNSSGQGWHAWVPDEVQRWNWGAFLIAPIWGIGNRIGPAVVLFIPAVLAAFDIVPAQWISLLTLPAAIFLGIKGSELSWKFKRWASVERFRVVQRRWAWAGLLATIALIGGSIALVVVTEDHGRYAENGVALRYPEPWSHGDADLGAAGLLADPQQPDTLWAEEFNGSGGGALLYALDLVAPTDEVDVMLTDPASIRSDLESASGLTLTSDPRVETEANLPALRFGFETPPGSPADEATMTILFGTRATYYLACVWELGSRGESEVGCLQIVRTFRETRAGAAS